MKIMPNFNFHVCFFSYRDPNFLFSFLGMKEILYSHNGLTKVFNI